MRQRRYNMDRTDNNKVYKIYKYSAGNWYDDLYD